MRQNNSPWSQSYDKFKLARRREQRRSQKQKEHADKFRDGFVINREPPRKVKLHPDDERLGKQRRKRDQILDDQRLKDDLKEIWE